MLVPSPTLSSSAPLTSSPKAATLPSDVDAPAVGGEAPSTPPSVDRVAVYDRALAGLRRHLLPLLQAELHDVAARTGLPAETLRKRRRDLERGERSLPGVEALAAIAAAYNWSLDALLDGESETPARVADAPSAVAPLLRAHIEHVVRSTVRRTRPWALNLILGDDPDWLLKRFEEDTAERVSCKIREREQQQQGRCEEEWGLAKARLAGDAVIEAITQKSPLLAPYSEILVGRIARAVERGVYDFTEGRFTFPTIPVRASDSWELARSFTPAIHAARPVVGSAIANALYIAFEVTDAEVDAARGALSRAAGRGAGLRACSLDEVLDVYAHCCDARSVRPNAPVSLYRIGEVGDYDKAPVHDVWALHDLFVAFCTRVGLVWHADTRHFTLGTVGRGVFDERLAPHLREPRMIVVPWGVDYWNAPIVAQPTSANR